MGSGGGGRNLKVQPQDDLIVARVRCRGRLWVPVLRTVCVLE